MEEARPQNPEENVEVQNVETPAVGTPLVPATPVSSSFAPQLEPEPTQPTESSLSSTLTPTPSVPDTSSAKTSMQSFKLVMPESNLPPEPIAPEPAGSSRATSLVVAMLTGAVLCCVMLGGGILLGRASVGSSGGDGMGGGVFAGVNDNSGTAITNAVKRIGPAVMNVDTTFGAGGDENFLPNPGEEGPRAGKGTGFIIDSKRGLMLTNAHVVAGAQRIQVTTNAGDHIAGRVIGFDRRTDIAVVEVSNKKLPETKLAKFTDAKKLDIGQWTIAIGNPYGQENTVTVGVLSAVGRTLPVPANERGEAFSLTDMMQTDTAINPGNSGGPLCNLRGEVIGINTAIIPFGQGLGFTIPIYKAKAVADQIIAKGKVDHPFIGVMVKPVTDAIKTDYGLPDKSGALVQGVEPNSPAAKSGLQPGDVIRKIDGSTMKSNETVVSEIGKKKVGDVVKIEVLRNNAVKKTITLKVGDRPN